MHDSLEAEPPGHTREQELEAALRGLLAEPYGCSLCNSGVSRNPTKGHQPDCPYEIARAVLAAKSDAAQATTYTDLIIRLTPVIHREGNMYVGWVQEVPGANAQAASGDELRGALEEAVMLIISNAKHTSQE